MISVNAIIFLIGVVAITFFIFWVRSQIEKEGLAPTEESEKKANRRMTHKQLMKSIRDQR